MYFDRSLRAMGFLGEGHRDNSVFVVKSHYHSAPTAQNGELRGYDRVIHLVRSPFDALVAERKRVLATHEAHTAQMDWSTFVNGRITKGYQAMLMCVLNWGRWMLVKGTSGGSPRARHRSTLTPYPCSPCGTRTCGRTYAAHWPRCWNFLVTRRHTPVPVARLSVGV